LRGENESLSELPVGLRLVGDLADDLDDDVDVGGLRIDVGDADLAVLELKLLYPVVDGLGGVNELSRAPCDFIVAYPLADADLHLVGLVS
jgi:hypothetical protein